MDENAQMWCGLKLSTCTGKTTFLRAFLRECGAFLGAEGGKIIVVPLFHMGTVAGLIGCVFGPLRRNKA